MGKIFSIIKVWLSDHYHLLFKSAADNHLRIQKCTDGSYQCIIRFASYTELKNYQKKVRRLTVSLSSAIAMVVVAFIVAPYIMNPNKSAASTFIWKQTGWGGNGDNGATTVSVSNQSGWTNYTSKNSNIAINANNQVTLVAPIIKNTGEAATADNVGDNSISTFKTGDDNFYFDNGKLTLKKVDGASCAGAGECKLNFCNSVSVCGKVANGSACGLDSDCVSNYCEAGGKCIAYPWINAVLSGASCTGLRSFMVYNADNPASSPLGAYPPCTNYYLKGGRLPTIEELKCIYANKANYGSFSSSIYWSSSKDVNGYNYVLQMATGVQSSESPGGSRLARCVK